MEMSKELNVALIAGPAYDPLYQCLAAFTEDTGVSVNVAFSGDHPLLNRHLASLSDVPYDLVSTHTKYAPSQLGFLAPLEGMIDRAVLRILFPWYSIWPTPVDHFTACTRNIDVRLLHYRAI